MLVEKSWRRLRFFHGVLLILFASVVSFLLWVGLRNREHSRNILSRAKRIAPLSGWAGRIGPSGGYLDGAQIYYWLNDSTILHFAQNTSSLFPVKLNVDSGEETPLPIKLRDVGWPYGFMETVLTPDRNTLLWRYMNTKGPAVTKVRECVSLVGNPNKPKPEVGMHTIIPPFGYAGSEAIWPNVYSVFQSGNSRAIEFRNGVLEFLVPTGTKREIELHLGKPIPPFMTKGPISRKVTVAIPGQGSRVMVTVGAEGKRLVWIVSEPTGNLDRAWLLLQKPFRSFFPSKPRPIRYQFYLSDIEGKNLHPIGSIQSNGSSLWQQPREPRLSPDGKRLGFYFNRWFYILDLPDQI